MTNYNSGGSPPFTATAGPTPLSYYAAGLCAATISGYSDWYLPAICEMGYGVANCGTSGVPELQNMQANLVNYNGLICSQVFIGALLNLQ